MSTLEFFKRFIKYVFWPAKWLMAFLTCIFLALSLAPGVILKMLVAPFLGNVLGNIIAIATFVLGIKFIYLKIAGEMGLSIGESILALAGFGIFCFLVSYICRLIYSDLPAGPKKVVDSVSGFIKMVVNFVTSIFTKKKVISSFFGMWDLWQAG